MDKSPDPRPRPAGDAPISEIRDYYFNYRNPDDWNNCFHTNVTATFTLTMAFLELLDAGNKRRDPALPTSQVITIGSVAAVLKFNDTFIYSASKAAVHHLMKNLGCYLVPHDIRTNIIAPGCEDLPSEFIWQWTWTDVIPRVSERHDDRSETGISQWHAAHAGASPAHG
jgi:NAD(P)-dependent dehydrogenase (short-subunit alcohol dehydrogenase family)